MEICIYDEVDTRATSIKTVIETDAGNGISITYRAQVYQEKTCPLNTEYTEDCASCANGDVTYHIHNCSVLFVHTSNNCSYGFIKNILQGDCANNCWIVCYSGGSLQQARSYQKIREKFPDISNIQFFPDISRDISFDTLRRKWNLKAFIDAVNKANQDKSINPFDYLVSKTKSHLIALSIICQGYLAANMKGYLPKEIWIADEKKPLTLKKDWWKPAFGEDFGATEINEQIEMVRNASGSEVGSITSLIEIIKGDGDNKEEWWNSTKCNGKEVQEIMSGKIVHFTNKVGEANTALIKCIR